jgi:hypothetical protein
MASPLIPFFLHIGHIAESLGEMGLDRMIVFS